MHTTAELNRRPDSEWYRASGQSAFVSRGQSCLDARLSPSCTQRSLLTRAHTPLKQSALWTDVWALHFSLIYHRLMLKAVCRCHMKRITRFYTNHFPGVWVPLKWAKVSVLGWIKSQIDVPTGSIFLKNVKMLFKSYCISNSIVSHRRTDGKARLRNRKWATFGREQKRLVLDLSMFIHLNPRV